MAIVEMKRFTLLAPKSDKEKLLRAMQRMNCVEIISPSKEEEAFAEKEKTGAEETETKLKRLSWALDQLKRFDDAPKPMFGTYPEISPEKAEEIASQETAYLDLIARLEHFQQRKNEMDTEETRTLAAVEQYTPWLSLDISPQTAFQPHGTIRYMAGTLPARNVQEAERALAAFDLAALTVVGSGPEMVCVIAAAHQEVAQKVSTALDDCDFTVESFSALGDNTPEQYLDSLQTQLAAIKQEREQIQQEIVAMTADIPAFKALYEVLNMQLNRQQAAGRFAVTETTFLLNGWVPAPSYEKVEQKVRKLSPSAALEFRDPLDEENPPIKLRNNKFVAPFETVVEGYSLPDYRGIDPTAAMAPFYACLFGMMVSDAGYGLVMALLIPIFMKIKKIKFENAKLLYLLTYGGIATIIWGLVYNTVFGFNPLPKNLWLLDSVNDSMPVMAVCIGMGAVHLFAGLGVAAYMNLKRGKLVAALADQVAWATLLVGLGLLLLDSTKQIGQIMALISVAVILLFTKRGEKNTIKRIFGGLGALYGITSWVSDLLSYMRLFGMGLATGVIGMVFNQLIGMIWGAGIVGKIIGAVLFVFCHVFNLGINALGAYVHSCRLQYIEFFGKFYEDGGKPFSPLGTKPKYVSIASAEADE